MLRRGSGAYAEVTLLQTAFDERELAQESVSQMIQNRHALASSGAEASAVWNGWPVGLLAGTLLLARPCR